MQIGQVQRARVTTSLTRHFRDGGSLVAVCLPVTDPVTVCCCHWLRRI